jgi:uncharacterized membrane protein YqjE
LLISIVALGLLLIVVEGARHHRPSEMAVLAATLVLGALAARWLLRDLRAHPAGFPAPSPAHGLLLAATGADGRRDRSRWASQNGTEG